MVTRAWKWVVAFLKSPAAASAATNSVASAPDTPEKMIRRGAQFHPIPPGSFPADFEVRLRKICWEDPNVLEVRLLWVLWPKASPELLATLSLQDPSELAIRRFVDRADALNGPRFIGCIAEGRGASVPFFRRSDGVGAAGWPSGVSSN